jgi:hypothetical protein
MWVYYPRIMSKKKEQRIQELVEAYKLVGLDDNFARAIAEGGNAKHIVATWKADWRGEHSAEHPAIKAVLVGNATPPEARSLLEAAELHRDLVDAVATGSRSMKWVHTVLSCGFKGRKEAVTALLGGADPAIIADLLDIELSSADAKIIGRKNHGKKTETIQKINLEKMTKAELSVECGKAHVTRSGTLDELSTRLKHYQKGLKSVVDGLMKDKFSIKGAILPKGWTSRYDSSRKQYLITKPGSSNYYHSRSRSSQWMNSDEYNRHVTDLNEKVTKKSISVAARYLGMKSTNYNIDTFKKLIMSQGVRYGVISQDDYDDHMDEDSNFNKA